MNASSLRIEEVIEIYLNQENWLTTDLAKRFSSNEANLARLVGEYDERLPQIKERDFNANEPLRIIIEVLKEKINLNAELNYSVITKLIKDYYDYLSDTWNIEDEVKTNMEELLDLLELKEKESKTLE